MNSEVYTALKELKGFEIIANKGDTLQVVFKEGDKYIAKDNKLICEYGSPMHKNECQLIQVL
jgi:hypothetical protein